MAVCLFLGSLAIYLSNVRIIDPVDSGPNALLPVALLTEGSLTFDAFARSSPLPPQFVATPHGIVSYYPIATGLMAVPIYAIPVALKAAIAQRSPEEWRQFSRHFQKFAAAILAAFAVVMFWRLGELTGFSQTLSFGLTAWFAFGSEIFSIGAQSLWQHGPGTIAILGAVWAYFHLRRRPSLAYALALSAWCGLAIAIRPTNLLIVAPFAAAALWQRPQLIAPLVMPAAAIAGVVGAYKLHFFGHLLGGYNAEKANVALSNFADGLSGFLFSLLRGLAIYFPVSIVAFGMLVARPRMVADPAVWAATIAILLTIVLIAARLGWWGGWCYGPRYLSEVEPLMLLLVGLGWQHIDPTVRRPLALACFGLLLPYSIMVQAVGVYSPSAWKWSFFPANVDHAQERLWDFVDNPISRGLHITSLPPQGAP